jgi:hypothetical protein
MSARKYSVDNLLVGKHYRSISRHDEGIINYAEKRDAIWYGENLQAYAIRVSPTRGINDFWATVAIETGE